MSNDDIRRHFAFKKAKEFLSINKEEYIAEYVQYKEQDSKEIFSTCTWTKGVPTIFPYVDYINLIDLENSSSIMMIPLNKFLNIKNVSYSIVDLSNNFGVIYYSGISYPELSEVQEILKKLS